MLYPIRFIPRLQEVIWGGKEFLANVKADRGVRITPGKLYGESWDISGLEGNISVVANGFLKKNNLEEIIEVYMGNLVGDKVYEKYGLTFPLLAKTLDCHNILSIQVHPDDALAAERHDSYGKTEMWYVIDAEPGSYLYIGFKDNNITREEFIKSLNEDTLPEKLNKVEVKAGDVFYIPAGTVHALGKGIKVVEIQQTSDVTYRIYDWNRVDSEGNARELHTALAIDAIDFSKSGDECHIKYQPIVNEAVKLIDCPYFTINAIEVDGELERDVISRDSFVLYTCINGEIDVEMDGNTEHLM
ncbi:MAG: class I mannose-6-phosphate isomerase, partial [Alistipes sp.]|nr:class I mannose-6-phosphate isomerase [Alistipes sp.]